jgi:hypothetical protein
MVLRCRDSGTVDSKGRAIWKTSKGVCFAIDWK